MFGLGSHAQRIRALEDKLAGYDVLQQNVAELAGRDRASTTFRDTISTKVAEVEDAVANLRSATLGDVEPALTPQGEATEIDPAKWSELSPFSGDNSPAEPAETEPVE